MVFASFEGHESQPRHGAPLVSLFDCIDGGAYDEARMRADVADLQNVLLHQMVLRDVGSACSDVAKQA